MHWNRGENQESCIKTIKLRRWDSAEHLQTAADIAAYLNVTLEEAGDDPVFIMRALGNIARARGMDQVTHDTGLTRERLDSVLSGEIHSEFATILKALQALGLKLHVTVA